MDKITVKELKESLRNPFVWPGGYEIIFIANDGELLCHTCVKDNFRIIIDSMTHEINDGWRVMSSAIVDHTIELTDDSTCAHCQKNFLTGKKPARINCDQCNPAMIQGIFCHESGCPNINKKWNPDSESWDEVYTCVECGSEYTDSGDLEKCCQPEDIELTDSEILYNEVKSQFKVNRHGIITSPGKFEGETLATPYFYNASLDGGDSVLEIESEDRELFKIESRYTHVLIYESNDGFVSLAYFETLQAAEESILNPDNDLFDDEEES